MLTARGDEMDRIGRPELGADDYLPKPFNPREPLARAANPAVADRPEASAKSCCASAV
jgi:two-component system phosphate regulon response regulator OmpR